MTLMESKVRKRSGMQAKNDDDLDGGQRSGVNYIWSKEADAS